jgi:EmrB/QacA subfamily drug resistance transporter
MQTLDSTILNTALPAMARGLGESPLRMQSVVISYMLTVALLIPASGYLSDRFGTRKVFSAAMVVFSLGSLACAASRSLQELVLARALQGVGGSLLLPVGRLTILKSVPRGELLGVLAFVTIPGLVGPLIGPSLGGFLVERLSWHWVFLINLPIGALGTMASLLYMPDLKEARQRFDWLGFLLIGLGMVSISLGFESLAERSLSVTQAVLLLVFGLACIVAYWLHAVRARDPLFHPKLWSIHSYTVGLAGNLFGRLGAGAMPFLTPLFLQVALGYAPTEAGLFMAATVLGAMGSKTLVERLVNRFGYRRFLLANTSLLGLSMMSFGLIEFGAHPAQLVLQLTLFGALNSLQFTAMNTLTLADLAGPTASSGNSLLSMTMQLSMSLGVAVGASILTAFGHGSVQGLDTALGRELVPAFHHTYLAMGVLGSFAALIFLQLSPDEPSSMNQGPLSVAEV